MQIYHGILGEVALHNKISFSMDEFVGYDFFLIRDNKLIKMSTTAAYNFKVGDMVLICSQELLDGDRYNHMIKLLTEESYIYPLQHIKRISVEWSLPKCSALLFRFCRDEPEDKTDTYLFKLRRRLRGSDEDFKYIEYFRTRKEAQYRLVEMNCFSQEKENYEYGISCFPDGNGAKWKQYEMNNTNAQKTMPPQELYIELQKSKYDERPFSRMKDWGEGMEIVEEVISNYWRERFLINHKTKEALEVMTRGLNLTFIKKEDVDWKGVETLDNNSNAYSFSAYYQRFAIGKFKNGVALVEWTLYPDGRYFMDEDGYGMEDNDESVLYGFIDTNARVVIPFQVKGCDEMGKQRPEAERRAKELNNN